MKSEKGFTLVEVVVALGVIAMIGSLLMNSVVSTSANTQTADLIAFMDSTTKEAREVFAGSPNEVLQNNIVSSDNSMLPYSNMAYQKTSENKVIYTQAYTRALNTTVIGSADAAYELVVTFEGKNKSVAKGFSFITQSFDMDASVYENINGVMSKEPIYTKKHTFDNITTQEFETSEIRKVEFYAVNGLVYNDASYSENLGPSETREYFDGSALYSTSVDGKRAPVAKPTSDKNTFIGWALDGDGRNLIQNDYKVTQDIRVKSMYLEENEYRLEFQVNGTERFNVQGIEGEATTRPYFVEKVIKTKPVKVKDMESNISRFFVKNAVRKNGYKFVCWEDKDGNEVTIDTIIKEPHMRLSPRFIEADNANHENISLNLTLDLSGVVAEKQGTDINENRLFACYPFTKMEYEVEYRGDINGGSFSVTQKEVFKGDYGSLSGNYATDGKVLSEMTFNTNDPAQNLYLSLNGNKYSTFRQYLDAASEDATHSFSISDIRLNVKMPTFSISDYYKAAKAKDTLNNGTISLDGNQAEMLFNNKTKDNEFIFSSQSNAPMNAIKAKEFNDKIAQMTENKGDFTNIGSVNYESTGEVSYDSYTKKITVPGAMEQVLGSPVATVKYDLSIPLSFLLRQNSVVMKDMYQTKLPNGCIGLRFQIYFDLGGGKWGNVVGGDIWTEIDTDIPIQESVSEPLLPGGSYIRQNIIQTVNLRVDPTSSLSGIWYKDSADFPYIKDGTTGDKNDPGHFNKLIPETNTRIVKQFAQMSRYRNNQWYSCHRHGAPLNSMLAQCITDVSIHENGNGSLPHTTYKEVGNDGVLVRTPSSLVPVGEYYRGPYEQSVEVLTFAKNQAMNYLPPFIKVIPYS